MRLLRSLASVVAGAVSPRSAASEALPSECCPICRRVEAERQATLA